MLAHMTSAFRIPMTGRSTDERHRVSSPLELLFDLTFVVAIAQVAGQLAHAGEEGHVLERLPFYFMVFFAIWWAWMNFTWFASAYDTDDVPYRVMTLMQMGGVLVLAAGVPAAFDEENFTRDHRRLPDHAGRADRPVDPGGRRASRRPPRPRFRYAAGVAAVQVLWVVWGFLPPHTAVWFFGLGVVLELVGAGLGRTHRHDVVAPAPHRRTVRAVHDHRARRVRLGVGCRRAARAGGERLLGRPRWIASAGLVLLFALWWLYFLEPAAEGLSTKRGRSYYWGYGHYFVFASLAALGAGLEVAVQAGAAHADGNEAGAEYAIAIPVAVFLVMLYVLHAPLVPEVVIRPLKTGIAIALVLLLPLASPLIGLVGVTIGIAVVASALVAVTLLDRAVAARTADVTTSDPLS